MKRTLTLLLILLLSAFSLFADDTLSTDTLTVKAYKNKKSNTEIVEMKVIDALTGTLATFKDNTPENNSIIDMTNYLKTYLGNTSVDQSSDSNLASKAAFSVHVTGNQVETFTLTVKFKALAYYGESGVDRRYTAESRVSADYNNYITARFYLIDYQYIFTDTDTSTVTNNGITNTIADATPTGYSKNVTVPSTTPSASSDPESIITYKWKVTSTDSSATYISKYWDVRATFAMILNEGNSSTAGSYIKAPNGIYKAPVTVSLTIGS